MARIIDMCISYKLAFREAVGFYISKHWRAFSQTLLSVAPGL
jgi:hypothetical protein